MPTTSETPCQEWYRSHGAAVYGFFRFHVASPDLAEDLTAETFLKLVRAAERFDGGKGTPRTWIFSVARNVLADHRRWARVRPYVPIGNLRDLVCDAPSAEERLLREEDVARLLNAVASLSTADRELIGLRYGSELETGEIAELLELREGAVRTRLWRALSRLRAELDE